MREETIFALASAAGRAGVAVFRVSGPGAARAFVDLTRRALPPARRAVRVRLCSPATGEVLDDGLGLWFPAPKSFTGEDVAELHLHGGRAVEAAVTDALRGLEGLRLAEPGEFTRRAFENGKFELTAAEGLADLVNAETEAQRRQARRQLEGELGAIYEGWRARLIEALAHYEAVIDFTDEELPADLSQRVKHKMLGLEEEISQHLDDNRRGERLRDGIYIAIIGAPNVGKSSLLNALARRDAAIVAETAGTTRDVVEVHLDLGGFPVIVADTAGLREAADGVEREGIRRAEARAAEADIRLALFDITLWPELDAKTLGLVGDDTVPILNKADLLGPGQGPGAKERVGGRPVVIASAKTGAGMAELLKCVESMVSHRIDLAGSPALTRARHRDALEQSVDALTRFAGASEEALAAEDLRLAARALGRITGRVEVDDILDVIFRDFCIGK
ncbi:MAG: tRNA uridine-5-carboxymethylaminomethyl(34) synthesis GTPase MnmE [Alphaproteobacteria bacterium]|nr:tRNA uridine-5-carboxymethylaminomethyl(34) synthesis GTPase MnmE [Pseudomonadota bacterium]TDI55858.1 MAG: tRNA uridine-5-carboxymethylaminomethyl(34) synthesis GTPase MnmE [Alphaproteobacteria bacterium]